MAKRLLAGWYDLNAQSAAEQYERLSSAELYAWAADLLPNAGSIVLDLGAGSGRDAAWFTSRGADVVAVEPSASMRAEAGRHHPGGSERWVTDDLPSLAGTTRLGLAFDLILLSAVWQHISPADRPRAFRKLVSLLRPGGLMLLTLRLGARDDERAIHEVSASEVERLAREHGLAVVRTHDTTDSLGRPELRWTGMALRLSDDGTGALPLLRHVMLIAEWVRLMKSYAESQGRVLEADALVIGTLWAEPERDTALPRRRARDLLEAGQPLHCVWSGKRLTIDLLDIDHCFPWSAWPCGDLWNLMPADRRLNQHSKRDKLPAQDTLIAAEGQISAWWNAAYIEELALTRRFREEAVASLPGLSSVDGEEFAPAAVLSAMHLQRLRLRHDQQMPEWRSA